MKITIAFTFLLLTYFALALHADEVDFESLGVAEGDAVPIINGISFSADIVLQGNPQFAFVAAAGTDTGNTSPFDATGNTFITNPGGNASPELVKTIEIHFPTPVNDLTFLVVDIDSSPNILTDRVIAEVFDSNDILLATQTYVAPTTGNRGDGEVVLMDFGSVTNIARLHLRNDPIFNPGDITTFGWGLDNLNFTVGPTVPAHTIVIVAQESAQGVGDFDDNVLGIIKSFATSRTAEQFYGWNNQNYSFNPPVLIPTANNQSSIFFIETAEGVVLFQVHDDHLTSNVGGTASNTWQLENNTAGFLARDDPNGDETFLGEGTSTLSAPDFRWDNQRTDGAAIGPLQLGQNVFASFQSFAGLTEWRALSDDGSSISLVLDPNRRVRFTVMDVSDVVVPTSILVTFGSVASGDLPEISESDDQYLVLDPEFLTFRYQLEFAVDATSQSEAPSALGFNYESRAFNFVGTIDQEIELFNYDSEQFETVDTSLTSSADTLISVYPAGDPARFVQPGTNAMQARISYQNSLPFWVFNTQNLYLPYRVRADHIFWTVTQ